MITKKALLIVLFTFCLSATLFVVLPAKSGTGTYDRWADVSGPIQGEPDGTINMRDINYLIQRFNTFGTPIDRALINESMLMENPWYKSGRLANLPFGAYGWQGDSMNVPQTGTILYSLDLDQNQLGNQQTIFAYAGTTINVTGEYQVFQSGNGSGAIMQAFFIYSWTPSWPPPNSTYYQPLYYGGPGPYPGTGKQTFSFNMTLPNTQGVYYIYWCMNAAYSWDQAVSQYTSPLRVPFAVITVDW